MQTTQTKNGFLPISVTPIAGLSAKMHFYRHEKTGAELMKGSYDDLLRFCRLLEKLNQQESTCIVGSTALLDACKTTAKNRLG